MAHFCVHNDGVDGMAICFGSFKHVINELKDVGVFVCHLKSLLVLVKGYLGSCKEAYIFEVSAE